MNNMQGNSFGNESNGRSSPLDPPNNGDYHPPQHENSQHIQGGPYRTKASSAANNGTAGLNERLNTDALDLSDDDNSIQANLTRIIASFVGKCCTPRQMLIVLRLLKAVTFCFLVLTMAADIMYLFFVSFVATKDVSEQLGGFRDSILRAYGLIMGSMALMIELDMALYVRYFSGLKGFIPRSLLLFFISTVTNSHPLNVHQGNTNDDNGGDDDAGGGSMETHMPYSSIAFQIVTSFILAMCAVTYFILGVLCFDRFTSRAFLSNRDPVASTALHLPPTPPTNDGYYDGVAV